ncbi:hypothetical protein U8C37_25440 (plasmid) [Sinorhizobium medicae]|uniref:hypothetical protein n=1 Tax=Sinorhizobium medicae TaxID=110321 RepID=UPI002AF6A844|nr:hypothetical protein [Sinorhizobium medicae]WQO88057.1 hypothetical protein U8C37_25440 [Sinorhizobium medicae]
MNISAVARRWGVNRGLLNVWRREAGADLLAIRASLRTAGDVPAGDSGWRTNASPQRVVGYRFRRFRSN